MPVRVRRGKCPNGALWSNERIMTTKIFEARRDAIQAMKGYIDSLKEENYNVTCIRDSVVCTALDALECYNQG